MSVRLVNGSVAELDALAAISVDAFDPRFGEAWSAAQLRGTLQQSGSWLRLACRDDAMVGFSLCRLIVDEAELLLIAVVPAARGGGIGSRLLAAAIDDAQDRGVSEIFLEMRDGNAAALALYRSQGFAEVGRRRDYYRGADSLRFDAITMRRPLNP